MRFEGLDMTRDEDRVLLARCQMGILKGHGRAHSVYHLVRLEPATARAFVSRLPVKSALDQADEAAAHRVDRSADFAFVSTALSMTGMAKLPLPPDAIPTDLAFRGGMKRASRRVLNDPRVESWESAFQGDVDLLHVVAGNDSNAVRRASETVRALCDEHGCTLLSAIHGVVARNADGAVIEPFGFADGISQPLFFAADLAPFQAKGDALAYDPSIDPRHLVLVRHPRSGEGYGSFLVIRKLAQDATAFAARAQAIAELRGADPSWIAAQAIGRFPDGRPLVPHVEDWDDFDYRHDPAGRACPFHAHVRKMNQRINDPVDPFHRIARRGVGFDETDAAGARREGLLFLCFQADIGRQFETLQARWANDAQFPPGSRAGIDPIIGRPGTEWVPQRWRTDESPDAPAFQAPMEAAVNLLGGEYMFAPPPAFFDSLRTPDQ